MPLRLSWVLPILAALGCALQGGPVAGQGRPVDPASGRSWDRSLPAEIPLFPLPDIALFPASRRSFHIFEPRYREMVADALARDSIIGMVMLEPGHEAEYEGRPPVREIGCAGFIVTAEALPDGRYMIVLQGVIRFRVLGEDRSRAYRMASVSPLPEVRAEGDEDRITRRRQEIQEALRAAVPGVQLPPASWSDEAVIDGLSLGLPLDPEVRQQLIEAEGPEARASLLLRILGRGASVSRSHSPGRLPPGADRHSARSGRGLVSDRSRPAV